MLRHKVLGDLGRMPEGHFSCSKGLLVLADPAGWEIQRLANSLLLHISRANAKKNLQARAQTEYHRSPGHFFRKNRGVGQAAHVIGTRPLKAISNVVVLAPLALASEGRRRRWKVEVQML